MSKFQKSLKGIKYGFQLFSLRNINDRPYSNDIMRKKFGQMCDAPSPKEYVDISSTSAEAVKEVVDAVTLGKDAMLGVVCRTIKGTRPPSLLCIKGIRDNKSDRDAVFR